ncbi:hypothetical protein [Nostoc phage A1]|uniref:Uncharacterized protein n=1 Tax=Nostoc phage A1 TaxID=1775256 RepID=A0ACD6B8W6_9CAUD|nr:hypothetical protein [Nostoc phage A1]
MTTQEFLSKNKTIESELLDLLIKPNTDDSILTRNKQAIADRDLFDIEWEPGQSLNKLATEYLGDSFAWQIIADANGIDPTKEIDIGAGLKVPDQKALENSIKKFIVNSPTGKQLISDAKQSILNLIGVGDSNTEFSKTLKDCIGKVVNFSFDNTQ